MKGGGVPVALELWMARSKTSFLDEHSIASAQQESAAIDKQDHTVGSDRHDLRDEESSRQNLQLLTIWRNEANSNSSRISGCSWRLHVRSHCARIEADGGPSFYSAAIPAALRAELIRFDALRLHRLAGAVPIPLLSVAGGA
jgi:hypothetical protein